MRLSTSRFLSVFILSIGLLLSDDSTAVQIVRFNIEYFNTDVTPIVENHVLDIELFDTVTPLTVDNFVSYINSGKYEESFVSRSVAGFIIQAGGFTFIPVNDDPESFLRPIDEMTGLEEVELESTSPVLNEFPLTTITNIRGTVAMAKLGFNPNSATSEWFINLADNRSNLNNQNAGFTVFGQVIDNGMEIADFISTLPLHATAANAINQNFGALPVSNYPVGAPIFQENLVLIRSTSSNITRPILRFTPIENILPLDEVDGATSTSLQTITLRNAGNETLTISAIIDTLSSEFVIESNNCSGVTLEPISIIPNATCDIAIRFTATALGEISSSLDIDYSSLPTSTAYSVSLDVTAEGVSNAASLTIDDINLVASSVDVFFGLVDQGVTETETLTFRNKGGTDLTITSVMVLSNATGEYTISNDNCNGTTLSIDQTCTLDLSFAHTETVVNNIDRLLVVTSDANDLNNIQLRGTIVAPVTEVLPVSVDFIIETLVGQSKTQTVTVTNTGTGLILETFLFTGTDANQFTLTNNCPTQSATLPFNGLLRTDDSCQIFVTFKPTSEGNKTADLIINSNDASSPTVIPVTGIATVPIVPVLNASVANISFIDTDAATGDTSNRVITINNIGNGEITISSIAIENDTDGVYSVDSIDCAPNSVLGTCDLTVSFTPTAGRVFSANLIVKTIDVLGALDELDIPLSGTGLAPSIIASIQDIFVGTSQLNGLSVVQRFTVVNQGNSNLSVTDISITGANSAEFSRELLCTFAANSFTLAPQFQCVIEVELSGTSIGDKTASLILTTDDPENPTLTINLTGVTDKDVDGISSSIEQQAPNNGDGNNDDIPDEVQNNVASFTAGAGGKAITLVSDDAVLFSFTGETSEQDTVLLDVSILDTIPEGFPTDESFDLGAYSFTIKVDGDISPDTNAISIEVGLFLPLDTEVSKFYRFGPTPDNPEPHLYDFTFDNATGLGARIIGPVTVPSESGDTINVNLVLINYIDGALGDDDLTINGFIVNGAAGLSTNESSSSSSGSSALSLIFQLTIFTLLLLGRRMIHRNQSIRARN